MMSRISLTLAFLFLIPSVLGCMHKGSNNSKSKVAMSYDDSDQDLTTDIGSRPIQTPPPPVLAPPEIVREEPAMDICESKFAETYCIAIYQPVTCIAGRVLVDGGNECEASKKANRIACETNQPLEGTPMECFAAEKSESCTEAEAVCTRERIDTICSVKDETSGKSVEALGANPCLARINLAKIFCLRDSKVDKSSFDCKSLTVK